MTGHGRSTSASRIKQIMLAGVSANVAVLGSAGTFSSPAEARYYYRPAVVSRPVMMPVYRPAIRPYVAPVIRPMPKPYIAPVTRPMPRPVIQAYRPPRISVPVARPTSQPVPYRPPAVSAPAPRYTPPAVPRPSAPAVVAQPSAASAASPRWSYTPNATPNAGPQPMTFSAPGARPMISSAPANPAPTTSAIVPILRPNATSAASTTGTPVIVGSPAPVGTPVQIGQPVDIGRPATIGVPATVGTRASAATPIRIGQPVEIGRPAPIGTSATIGVPSSIGAPAQLGCPVALGTPVGTGIPIASATVPMASAGTPQYARPPASRPLSANSGPTNNGTFASTMPVSTPPTQGVVRVGTPNVVSGSGPSFTTALDRAKQLANSPPAQIAGNAFMSGLGSVASNVGSIATEQGLKSAPTLSRLSKVSDGVGVLADGVGVYAAYRAGGPQLTDRLLSGGAELSAVVAGYAAEGMGTVVGGRAGGVVAAAATRAGIDVASTYFAPKIGNALYNAGAYPGASADARYLQQSAAQIAQMEARLAAQRQSSGTGPITSSQTSADRISRMLIE
jgi:hypothetical protein